MLQEATRCCVGTLLSMVVASEFLADLNADQLRELASDLIANISELRQSITSKDREILYRGTKIDQLTHEIAVLKRLASLRAAGSNLMRARPACSTRPSALTSQRSSKNSRTSRRRLRQTPKPASNPNVQPYQLTCVVSISSMNPIPQPASVAANSNASAKTSASVWTRLEACSRSSATSAASGHAPSAKP